MDQREDHNQTADIRALLMDWDPIGVSDVVECQDEYDCMIGPLLGHLRGGADAVFLRDWIARERVDHFGLNPELGADRKLADALVSWRDDNATASSPMDPFTAEDYESVERASHELHARGWRKAFTLNEMLDAWASLVAEVELGYDQMVDEYANDLASRDWIALVWPMVTERVRAVRADGLEALDARFREATLDDGGVALGRYYRVENKDGWWWRRRPIRVAGAFAADLATD